uniref:Reverse transcriptase domain-containing protein n=1 Tax=Oreochromis niloticus TaxID=8128 RepID=A0A669CP39_ORENI
MSRSKYQKAAKIAKTSFLSNIIATNSHNPRVLFKIFNSVVNPCPDVLMDASPALCEKFLNYFVDKISLLRASHPLIVNHAPISVCSAAFHQFELVSLTTLKELINTQKNSNSLLDTIPSRIIKEAFDTIGPCILLLMNLSLSSGCVPTAFKNAVVQPVIKKASLDHNTLANYRPISKLPFLSKILEKIVLQQLQTYLERNGLYEKFQSGFRQRHSTETALLRVFNDLLLITDTGCPAILVLLDLTSAFDAADHDILLTRLEQVVGLKGTVLTWFKSYFFNRSFSVTIGKYFSTPALLRCGVPQGSVLGPVLFSLYLLPLSSIFAKHNVSFHCYADDIQIYLHLTGVASSPLHLLLDCLRDVKEWVSQNFLTLNEKKTEIIVFDRDTSSGRLNDIFGPAASHLTDAVRNLGVIMDSSFKLDKQVSSVVKSSFHQLRLISKAKSYIPYKDLEKLIHAFITTRLDYCNSLYMGLQLSLLQRLQLVQNAAARLLTGSRKYDSITPVLANLHWLPIKFRIDFKVLLFTYKILNNMAPDYLADLLCPYSPIRALRSSDQLLLVQPRSRLKTRGDRAFAVAAPRLWNTLPFHIRDFICTMILWKALWCTSVFEMCYINKL